MSDKQIAKINKETKELVVKAKDLVVSDQLNYDIAARYIKDAKRFMELVKEEFKSTLTKFKELKKSADDGRKDTIAKIDKHSKDAKNVIDLLLGKVKKFEDDEEVKRVENQKKLDKAAEEKAAEDKKALEDQAAVDKAWGDDEAAEEKKEEAEAVVVETVKAKPTIAKTAGLGIRRTWQWKIINEAKIPRKYLTLDLVAINREVQAQHDETNIPGIEAFYG